MTVFIKSTVCFVLMIFLAVTLLPATAFAQSNEQLQNRVGQLEKQIQTMSRVVYRGESIPEPNYGQTATTNNIESTMANIEIRISSIEKQLRITTGQLERYEYENRELKKRLQTLENRKPVQGYTAQKPATTSTTLYTVPKQTKPTTIVPSSENLGTLTMPATSSIEPTIKTTPAITIAPPEKSYEQAYTHIRDGKYKKAAMEFKEFLKNYPNNKLSSNAQYWLSETYYVRGEYTKAAKMFAKGYEKYPKSPKTADNLLKLGLSLSKIGNKKDACLTFSQLEKEFPNKAGMIIERSLKEQRRLECNSM